MSMEKILAPTIKYAREGFPVSELIAYYLERSAHVLQEFAGFKETYMPDGKIPAKGEIFRNPALANTLELIAQKGRMNFIKDLSPKQSTPISKSRGDFFPMRTWLLIHRNGWNLFLPITGDTMCGSYRLADRGLRLCKF
ncbi:gamma-glutamyltranspeptidase [Geofilum rubicundum JCM 15548]|uniref:Gamma-glutamyltranspeptidase n=1 Tax=Geofilum rubicundum JCM 15548 TaxID=1236989 RepID=A0A0E9LXV9_9BACT|nr:gamma-glutamyltranspeptidase [Geofilum rubicundum JCM 15548]